MTSVTTLAEKSMADEGLREFSPAFSPIQVEGDGDKIDNITVRHAVPNELLSTLSGELSANAAETAQQVINTLTETAEVNNPKAVWIQSMKKSISGTVAVFTAQEWKSRLDSPTRKSHTKRHRDAWDRQNHPRSIADGDEETVDVLNPPQGAPYEAVTNIKALVGSVENTPWVENTLTMSALFREQFQQSLSTAFVLEDGANHRELTGVETTQIMDQFDYLVVEGISQRYLQDFIGTENGPTQIDQEISGLITAFVEGFQTLEMYNNAIRNQSLKSTSPFLAQAYDLQVRGLSKSLERDIKKVYEAVQELIVKYNTQTQIESSSVESTTVELINASFEHPNPFKITEEMIRQLINELEENTLLPKSPDDVEIFKFASKKNAVNTQTVYHVHQEHAGVYKELQEVGSDVLTYNIGAVFIEHTLAIYTAKAAPSEFSWGQELGKRSGELSKKIGEYTTGTEAVKILSILQQIRRGYNQEHARAREITEEEVLRLTVVLLGRMFWSENLKDFDNLSSIAPYNVPLENSDDPRAHFHMALDILELAVDSYVKGKPRYGISSVSEAGKLASVEFQDAVVFMRAADKQYEEKGNRSVFYAPVAPRILGLGKKTDPRDMLKTPDYLL